MHTNDTTPLPGSEAVSGSSAQSSERSQEKVSVGLVRDRLVDTDSAPNLVSLNGVNAQNGAKGAAGLTPSPKSEVYRTTIRIQEMPTDERPRERLTRLGPSACTSAELLAILMRTGSRERSALGLAEELIKHFGGLRGAMQASVREMTRVKGIGEVKAIEIAAAVELGKRLAVITEGEKPMIRCPQDVSNLMMPELRDERQEHLKVLMMDTKNRVIKIVHITTGILDSSLVHPREVFREAIIANAASVIIVHNHPSGDPMPSSEDARVTTRLAAVGKEIGIEVLDHIILGHNRFVSLKDRGLL